MEEKLFKFIEQLAAEVSTIKQDVKEIKTTVTKIWKKKLRGEAIWLKPNKF